LTRRCSHCGALVRPSYRFCGSCGRSAFEQLASAGPRDEEARRQARGSMGAALVVVLALALLVIVVAATGVCGAH